MEGSSACARPRLRSVGNPWASGSISTDSASPSARSLMLRATSSIRWRWPPTRIADPVLCWLQGGDLPGH
eukprot:6207596-Alexandrium_andersonii.AAC.1